MAGKVFVFDLDDTLMDNLHDYAEPILDTCRWIVKTLGRKAPHVNVIIALEHEIDSRRVKEINPATGKPYLYSMERFPGSMVEVYREVAKRAGIATDPELEKEFYAIGMRAFDERRYYGNIVPSAKAVLNFLRSQGGSLWLLTKGDRRVQEKKLAALQSLGINHFTTSGWRVVDQKNFAEFKKIMVLVYCVCDELRESPPRNFYSVGNSYDSDIKPALAAGFKGILVPVETWDLIGKMDDVINEAGQNGVTVLNDLGDIITRYEEL